MRKLDGRWLHRRGDLDPDQFRCNVPEA